MPKSLFELNALDNFLFNELISQENPEDVEKFCRTIIEPIIRKKIRNVTVEPQHIIQGITPDNHGIQMDVYIKAVPYDVINSHITDKTASKTSNIDLVVKPTIYNIEPNTYDKEDINKRIRFYHSIVDAHFFDSGYNYSELPEVVIIFISPFDLLGQNRMMYTISRSCQEDSKVQYNDGDITYYLYIHGTKDIPSQELSDMLHYLEKSTSENAKSKELSDIHSMVNRIKSNREIEVKYMHTWDREFCLQKKARNEGRTEAQHEFILELLSEYGDVPENIIDLVNSTNDEASLKHMLLIASKANSFEEFLLKNK